MHAQKMQSPLGECSFCALRNLPKFCEKIGLACSVITDDDVYTVTWQPNIKGLKATLENGISPREMTDFFNNTNAGEIKTIMFRMAQAASVEKQK